MLACALVCASALAQAADLVFVNGRIHTLDAMSTVAEAIAIKGERIVAVRAFPKMKPLIAKSTRVVDLHGRTVIPGLIDSHMHAIRATLSSFTGVKLDRDAQRPGGAPKTPRCRKDEKTGDWLIIAGGWTPEQFAEKRRPTQAELAEASQGWARKAIGLPTALRRSESNGG
jgi:predicted amidohydrolase YtcJ